MGATNKIVSKKVFGISDLFVFEEKIEIGIPDDKQGKELPRKVLNISARFPVYQRQHSKYEITSSIFVVTIS